MSRSGIFLNGGNPGNSVGKKWRENSVHAGQEGTFSDSEEIQEKNLEKIRGKDG